MSSGPSVVYQIYPRSFLDTTGSGVGDLDGVTARLDHLRWLGVDALWLSPVYPSPGVDGGYDVADHRDVDTAFGGLPALDRLLAAAHERGLRVLLDWVPNHTSDAHPWFVSSCRDPAGPHGDWYWWADEPASNWRSAFGGPAWTRHPVRGQYYLHLFTPAQPDLNWNRPGVRAAMLDGLRFWLDRGVDGFRADVVHLIGRDPALPDLADPDPANPNDLVGRYRDPRTHDLLREIRAVLDAYPDRFLVGEVPLADAAAIPSYVDSTQLHRAFDFSLMEADWSAAAWRSAIAAAEAAYGPERAPAWALSSHDQPRHRTRHGGRADRARVAACVLLTLRGTPFLYAGEELGLTDPALSPAQRVDPLGRDGSRAPVPWTPGPGHGWASPDPWLPWPPSAATRNAATRRADPGSILWLYRRLISLRRQQPALRDGDLTLLDAPDGVLAYRRGALAVRANFTDVPVPVAQRGRVLLSSGPAGPDDGELPPCTAIVSA
ncbi:MAG TPA: alpha-amylase family glycosyl hydrolase [Actinophytocola sp.]|nr:alpha-amylase family glycosyl hydrolase [Actinophytocola sp.]